MRPASATQRPAGAVSVRLALAFLGLSLLARLVAIFATGFCDDEAYVVTISRVPALSYFDHPPLHQWVLEAWTAAFGEGRAARLPFLGFEAVTAAALFGLARRLFSIEAAWWTVFAFLANPYFLVHPDGYIMPDPPLFACVALGVWAVAEILYCPRGRDGLLWLAAGLAFGLAGLAKYSAVFAPLGLAGFFLTSAKGRRWLADPRPYAGAALSLVCLAPVLVWNARHDWVSLAFQTGRAARGLSLDTKTLAAMLESVGAQIAAMSPWMLIPLLGGIVRAFARPADTPERMLLWQALPPLLLFAVLPLMGVRPISHWFNSGWLFAFPLAGVWLAERAPRFLARFATMSAALAGLAIALFIGAVDLGLLPLGAMRDPTRGMFDYPPGAIRAAYAKSGADFVLIENWRLGGRLGVALGPSVPICAKGSDPRGFAFACDASRWIGHDGFVVDMAGKSVAADASHFFTTVERLPDLPIGRRGKAEETLRPSLGRGLKRAPPLPYGP